MFARCLFWMLIVITTILLTITSVQNSYASVVVTNGLTHLHKVNSGDVVIGKINIQNTKDSEQAVKVYQRDYLFFHTGEAHYNEPGSHTRSNANWMDISPTYLTLGPNEKATILYEIKVPENVPLDGTFWSVIMVEGVKPVRENALAMGVSINSLVRYAIQIVSNIGETGERNLEFLQADLNNTSTGPSLQVAIKNVGERLLIPELSVELFDESGESKGVFTAEKKKLYPLTSSNFMVDLKGIEPGNYQAVILADCSEEDVFGVNLELKIPNPVQVNKQ